MSPGATDRLFESEPFDHSPQAKGLFLESFREAAAAHYQGNPFFRRLWEKHGWKPERIQGEEDLAEIPWILVNLFKEHELRSVPIEEVVLTLTSSGTGGQKSQIFLNHRSLNRVKRLAYQIHRGLGMVAPEEEVSYLCFTYDPAVAKDLGTAFTDELLTNFTGRREVYYALQWDPAKSEFVFNREATVAALRRFGDSGSPVRILGFPAFLHQMLEQSSIRLDLGPKSWVQTGGGWKGFADEEIPKDRFRRLITERLGIAEGHVRDMFGMVEHGIPYVDCEKGRLHIPNYARVFVRSPSDLSLVKDGERGLLQFLCSYVDSYPSISLLTTDWGRIGDCDCPIGRRGGKTLEVLGRAGVKKHKGCAITALDQVRMAA